MAAYLIANGGIDMQDTERKEAQTTETVDETTSALDELLSKVTLRDPLVVEMKNGRTLEITTEDFVDYYLPSDATKAERANCFNEVRAAGLNPAIRGDCHFFRTGDQPMHLFIGYYVYLRHAWASALTHIQKPIIEMGEDGHPFSCTITLEIEGRPDFEWTTFFWEVAATNRDNKLNKRWEKAPNQMFTKCSLINTFRLSGLVDMTLPPAVEEMGIPTAPGHRTLTQTQLDAYEQAEDADVEQEAALGEVTAATHQVDTSGLRRKYFKLLEELEALGLSLADDEERQTWQKEQLGRESVSDVSAEDWPDILMKVTEIKMQLAFEKQESEANEEVQKPMTDEEAEVEKQKAQEAVEAKAAKEERERLGAIDDQEALATREARKAGAQPAQAEEPETDEEVNAGIEAAVAKMKAQGATAAEFRNADPEYQKLRRSYQDRIVDIFRRPETLEYWQELVTGEAEMSDWTHEQLELALNAIPAILAAKGKYVDSQDFAGRDELGAEYQEQLKGAFDSGEDLITFQRKITGYNSSQDFGVYELQTALMMLEVAKVQRVVDEASELEWHNEQYRQAGGAAPVLDIDDEGTPVRPGETEPPDTISKLAYSRMKELAQGPRYKGMGSGDFRHKVYETIGYIPKRMATMTEDEGAKMITALEAELEPAETLL